MLNIGMIIVSPFPCSLPFYTTIAFKSYIPLTFSERRMFFVSCFIHFFTASILTTGPYVCMKALLPSNTFMQLFYIKTRAPSFMHCSRRPLFFRIRAHCTLLYIGLLFTNDVDPNRNSALFITAYTSLKRSAVRIVLNPEGF